MATSVAVTAQAAPGTTETAMSFSGVGQDAFTTVPDGKTLVLSVIRAANSDSSAHKAYASRVPASGSAGTGNRILPGISVAAGDAVTDDSAHVLVAGQSLSVKAEDASVAFTVSGVLFA